MCSPQRVRTSPFLPPTPDPPIDAFGLVQQFLWTGEALNGFHPLDIHSVPPPTRLRGVSKAKGLSPAGLSTAGAGVPDGGGRREGAGLHGAQRRRQARHPLDRTRRRPGDPVLLRLGLHERVPRPALRDARLDGRPPEVGCEGVRHQHGQLPQPSRLQGTEPPQLPVAERLEQEGQRGVRGALRSLRKFRPPGRDETIGLRARRERGHPVQVGHGGPEGPARPCEDSRGSQEARGVRPRYCRTCSAVFTSGTSTEGTVPPSVAPVFISTTRSSRVIAPSSYRRRRPARVAAPSRHAPIPSRTARFNAATFIAASETATAAPRVSRIARSTIRSAKVAGTRRPAATVCGIGHGSAVSRPAFQALTSGAQPSAWMTPKRGHVSSYQPSSRSSCSAFHIPTIPVPPPVGNRIQSGMPPSASQISKSIVFFPSIRYGSRNVARLKRSVADESSLTIRPASAMSSSTRRTSAPNAVASRL